MESQPLEQPFRTALRQSRALSDDVNAISRSSKAEVEHNTFLTITLCLGFSAWLVSLISQAIVAATINNGNAEVRLLWFGTIIQLMLLVEIFEVVISGNMVAYSVQISIFAALATVFAVLGVDQNIYTSSRAKQGTGAGWLVIAIVDLLWIIHFTSPPDSHFTRLANALSSCGPFSRHSNESDLPKKISRSQDAFVMSPPNGASDARPGAEALIGLGLDPDEYATLAAVDIDKLKEERMRGSERLSGYNFQDVVPQRRGSRAKSGGLWGDTRTTTSSGVTDGARGVERDTSALSSGRGTSIRPGSGDASVSTPETPTQMPTHLKATQSKATRVALQPVDPPQPVDEPIAQWKAEALFDYPGASDDPSELSFKKGHQLTIFDKSGKWWEARTPDGRRGIAPSNYLRLII